MVLETGGQTPDFSDERAAQITVCSVRTLHKAAAPGRIKRVAVTRAEVLLDFPLNNRAGLKSWRLRGAVRHSTESQSIVVHTAPLSRCERKPLGALSAGFDQTSSAARFRLITGSRLNRTHLGKARVPVEHDHIFYRLNDRDLHTRVRQISPNDLEFQISSPLRCRRWSSQGVTARRRFAPPLQADCHALPRAPEETAAPQHPARRPSLPELAPARFDTVQQGAPPDSHGRP